MQGNLEKELEPDLDQVINNIQVKPIKPVERVVPITKSKQLVVVAAKTSQPIQLVD
jgi:hypothetical protein